MKKSAITALAFATTIVAGAAAAQSTTFYSTGADGTSLYTINSATAASTKIGDFGYGGTYALAFNAQNTLYGVVDGYNTGTLATINTTTGAATVIGATNIPEMMALVFANDGTLYGASWGTDSLYRINVATGTPTLVGALGFSGIMDLAFAGDGTLYGISNGLYKINTTTGLGTAVSTSVGNGCMMGMTIVGTTGYTTDYCSSNAELYTINLANGALTAVGATGINSPMALTYKGVLATAAVPEPATWALMLVGFGTVGFAMRRRRRIATKVTWAA